MKARQTDNPAAERLSRRFRRKTPPLSVPPDDRPGCGYGLVVRASLDQIRQDVAELKGRVNSLGAMAVEVILRLVRP